MRPFSQPAFVPNSVYCGGARQRPKNAASTGAETGPLAGLDRPANVANYAAHRAEQGCKEERWTERLSPRAPGSEVGGELGVSFRSVGMRLPAGTSIKETTMSPLRARMIEDMTLAGLAVGTQKIYIQAVRRLAAHCRRSPDELGEEEVRRYLLGLRQRGVARGTFKTGQYGLRFLYRHTLGRDWLLFGEKKDRLATAEAAA